MESLHDFDETADAVLDVDAVAALEKRVASTTTPLSVLMARAGAALADAVRAVAPLEAEHTPQVAVLCGSGNNGGDGWVCARVLAQDGYPVSVVATKRPDDVRAHPAREAALQSEKALEGLKRPVLSADDDRARKAVLEADVVVDALLGTGFSGTEVTGAAARLIGLLNESAALIVAADVPSGRSAQTGAAATPCARADYTVAMICAKTGLAKSEQACGRLLVAPLGVDARA